MLNKRMTFLLVVLALSAVYSVLSLLSEPQPSSDNIDDKSRLLSEPKQQPSVHSPKLRDESPINYPNSGNDSSNIQDEEFLLPLNFIITGARPKTDMLDALVLIEYQGELFEYGINDVLLNTSMRLIDVEISYIEIEYDENRYRKEVSLPNILVSEQDEKEDDYEKMMSMTAREIGSRPRIIEHLFKITQTPFIADGVLVEPGLSPSLFKKAGFQEDDVLKTINGKSVTIEAELEAIKEELKNAHTLEFQVMRKGRIVTLYLDIPSEALEIRLD